MTRMSKDAEELARVARAAGRRMLADTGHLRRAWEQLAMTLVQEEAPAQLAGALAAAALDAVVDAAAADDNPGRPRVVVLCGSTRFKDDFERVNRGLTLGGHIVLAPGVFGHADGIELSDASKEALDALHFRKIDLADRVFVVNPGGYIGASTRNEIAYARRTGKPIDYLHGEAGEDLTTAGEPHPVAAARAQAAAGSPQHQQGPDCPACASGQTSRTAHTIALAGDDQVSLAKLIAGLLDGDYHDNDGWINAWVDPDNPTAVLAESGEVLPPDEPRPQWRITTEPHPFDRDQLREDLATAGQPHPVAAARAQAAAEQLPTVGRWPGEADR